MPKESVDEWCIRIAKRGGGRASAYFEEFEGDADEDEDDDTDDQEEEAASRQAAARRRQQLQEQVAARRALEERAMAVRAQELAVRQEWVQELRTYIEEHIYGKNHLIKQMLGAKAATPIADEYFSFNPAVLSEAGFELARKELATEALAVAAQFEKAKLVQAARTLKELLASEIRSLHEARAELEDLGRDLEFQLGRPPYADPGSVEMSEAEVVAARDKVAEELRDIQLRRLFLGKRKWQAGELTDLEGDAQTARDQLVAALKAPGDLPAAAASWVVALNSHAATRAVAIKLEELQEHLGEFIAANPGKKIVKELMQRFAAEYGYDIADWARYQKVCKELVPKKAAAAVPLNGIIPLATMNRMSGGTAGQRYTPDETFVFNGLEYYYHLSVSYSAQIKKGEPDLARITDLHVSFKRGKTDKKYWFTIANGRVTFRETAGGAAIDNDMYDRAFAVLRRNARKLRYTVA